MIYFTAGGSVTVADRCVGIRVTVNAALTGTITVTDTGATIAVITNPAVGGSFIYFGFKGAAAVNPSTTCDVTVSILSAARA